MKYKHLFTAALICIIFALLPFVCIYIIGNGSYPNIPLEITDDSLYYFTRAIDVSSGHLFIGNPYIFEHKDSVSAAFFVADWIWAMPLLLGFSIFWTIVINQIFWFIVFGLLLYWIFSLFFIPQKISFLAIIFCTFLSYWYLSRPVAMQVVFPFFLGFIITLYYFIKDPNSWKNRVFFGVCAGFSLYIYTYLAEIIALIFVFIFVFSLLERFKKWRGIFYSGLLSLILALPFLGYTWLQINTEFYSETLVRLGLLYTHMIGGAGLFYFILSVFLCIWIYKSKSYFSDTEFYFLEIISGVLAITVISNIFTGIDFELAVHVGRFIDLWLTIAFIVIIYRLKFQDIKKNKIFVLFLTLPIILLSHLFIYEINIWRSIDKNLFANEAYEAPLLWLKNNTSKESVILANDSFSEYVYLISGNYVLFSPYVSFQVMSNKEVEDRYLASRIFDDLSLEQIRDDFRKFAGVGNAIHQANLLNRPGRLCFVVKNILDNIDCPSLVNPHDLKGESYFEDMKSNYDALVKNPKETLKKYHVSHIVIDEQNDKWIIPKSLRLIWHNERFKIFKATKN